MNPPGANLCIVEFGSSSSNGDGVIQQSVRKCLERKKELRRLLIKVRLRGGGRTSHVISDRYL